MKIRIVIHAHKPWEYFMEGKPITKAEYDAALSDKPTDVAPMLGNTPSCWPMKSDALAVHPSQIPEAMERNKKHNVHVEYDPKDGRAILADRGQRRDLCNIEGVHDRQGGYAETGGVSRAVPKPPKKIFGMD